MSAAGVVQSQIQFHIKLLCSIFWIEAHALTYYIGCEPMWACNITTWPLEELHPVLALKWQKPLKNSEVCEENWDAIFLLPPYMLQPSLRATCPSIRARHLQFFFRCWSIAATSSSSSGFANEGICRGVLLGWNPLLLQCWPMPKIRFDSREARWAGMRNAKHEDVQSSCWIECYEYKDISHCKSIIISSDTNCMSIRASYGIYKVWVEVEVGKP